MDEHSLQAIKNAVHQALDERDGLSKEQHREHHQFVKEWIERSQARRQMWQRVRGQVLTWGIMGVITGLLLITWDWIVHFVQNGGRPPSSGIGGGAP